NWNTLNKFPMNCITLSPILLQKGVSLGMKGSMYSVAVRSAILYGAVTWPMRKEDMNKLERTQMRALCWTAGVSSSERRTTNSIRRAFGLDPIIVVAQNSRQRSFGHAVR